MLKASEMTNGMVHILANPHSNRRGPRKWKIRKLRRPSGRPTQIVLYMPFYLGEFGRYPTFEAAFKTAEAIELRAYADRKRNG